ncbi:hypothetical protein AC249_AIPGENE23898, partial [Exaiptasia diaphana]
LSQAIAIPIPYHYLMNNNTWGRILHSSFYSWASCLPQYDRERL